MGTTETTGTTTSSATGGDGAAGGGSANQGGTAGSQPGAATSTAGSAGAPAPGSTTAGAGGAATPPAFTPNFKFKYMTLKDGKDEQVEGELDDFFKPLVKDADSQKKLLELHEKAYGIDYVKSERGKTKEQLVQLEQKHASLNQSLAMAGQFVKIGDFDSFFEMLQIPPQHVLQWAIAHAQRAKNPEAKAAFDAQRELQHKVLALQNQNAELSRSYDTTSVQARENDLTLVMARPEISAAVAAFDKALGRPGAFRAQCIRRGQYHAAVHRQDVAAEQVVAELLAEYQGILAAPAGQPGAPANGTTTVAAPQPKPVIPHVPGKGTSPAKRVPKSLDDLKKIRDEKIAAAQA